ncbi:unnamed protein product [Pleuronectes platessa]|uniref:Uncharacterized protein n=1 Tax=Pleuronectes platessa TaxID=8262 RepID=A0A9N7US43_PLEPL|nr:unnamed protein product [Pleuronectes platessa]
MKDRLPNGRRTYFCAGTRGPISKLREVEVGRAVARRPQVEVPVVAGCVFSSQRAVVEVSTNTTTTTTMFSWSMSFSTIDSSLNNHYSQLDMKSAEGQSSAEICALSLSSSISPSLPSPNPGNVIPSHVSPLTD